VLSETLRSKVIDNEGIETHFLRVNKVQFDLNNLIKTIIKFYEKQINKPNITLKTDLTSDNTLVQADKGWITQVINNLLNNAFKFTAHGSIVVSTEFRNERKNKGTHSHLNSVIVSVKDTGISINPEILPRLFEKFATKSSEGTGLGLYISKYCGSAWWENTGKE